MYDSPPAGRCCCCRMPSCLGVSRLFIDENEDRKYRSCNRLTLNFFKEQRAVVVYQSKAVGTETPDAHEAA